MGKEGEGSLFKGLKRTWHANALDAAIFWGKPGWAQREAKALGLDEDGQHKAVRDAYINAASREEIIHGNHQKAWEHTKKAFNIPDENPPEIPKK